jgi:hypothetical protein
MVKVVDAAPTTVAQTPRGAPSSFAGYSPELESMFQRVAQEAAAVAVNGAMAQLRANPGLLNAMKTPHTKPVQTTSSTQNTKALSKPAKAKAVASQEPEQSKQLSLNTKKRGAAVAVVPSVQYGGYSWNDICHVGERLEKGTLNLSDLKKTDEDGDPLYKVPYKTMANKWAMDDRKYHESQHKKGGIVGVPHWRAELDVRRRNAKPHVSRAVCRACRGPVRFSKVSGTLHACICFNVT